MRIDDYLSTVGAVKRRTIAKRLADSGLIAINGQKAKASHQVDISDIVTIKGSRGFSIEVLEVPTGSVSKDDRPRYFKEIAASTGI